jgi:hypothetical protein
MELINKTVWVVSCIDEEYNEYNEDCFAVFSSKEYAEEYKKQLIEKWEKSITRDTVPRDLNSQAEQREHAPDYPEVIQVGKDHYERISGMFSNPKGHGCYWRYQLLSNADWDDYYQRFVSNFIIKDYVILK